MSRRKDYLNVQQLYVKQKVENDKNGIKKRLFDTRSCLDIAGSYLNETSISQSSYDSLLQTKQSQLQSLMSVNLEVDNLITIIQNSADMLHKDVVSFVRVSWKFQNTNELIAKHSTNSNSGKIYNY